MSEQTALVYESAIEFLNCFQKKPRLLGLDLGTKTIGVATCDRQWMIASSLSTLERTKFSHDAKTLEAYVLEWDIGGFVLGLPRNMDGSEGKRAQSTRQFAQNLLERPTFNYPILLWDERLSTVAVERVLIGEADLSRKKRAPLVDKMAASFILQGALDAFASQAL